MTLSILLYSFLIFLTSFLGGTIPLMIPRVQDEGLKLFVALGAGLLLGMAFLHMLPEAAKLIPNTFGAWFLFGFLLLYILEKFLMVHACEEHACNYHTIGIAAFAGLTVHGIIEGFALASTMFVTTLGPLVLIAILSHKVPSGFALTSILKLSAKSNRKILGFVTGVSLSGPAGVLVAYGLLRDQKIPASAGILLAISAGTFLYISACDLIPEVHRTQKDRGLRLCLFLTGVGLSYISEFLMP